MKTRGIVLAAAGVVATGALWWRKNPSACPYGQRFWVQPPHPIITRARLRDVLAPRPGERILEVGPGTGYYSLHVADWISPQGQLDIVDRQQKMLDHTMARAAEANAANIVATHGDARELPYPDAAFDAVYLTAVLGEIPDQVAALHHIARVLKPGGRLVVGELFGDPHWVSPTRLRDRAASAGLTFVRRSGSPLGYFARFER